MYGGRCSISPKTVKKKFLTIGNKKKSNRKVNVYWLLVKLYWVNFDLISSISGDYEHICIWKYAVFFKYLPHHPRAKYHLM